MRCALINDEAASFTWRIQANHEGSRHLTHSSNMQQASRRQRISSTESLFIEPSTLLPADIEESARDPRLAFQDGLLEPTKNTLAKTLAATVVLLYGCTGQRRREVGTGRGDEEEGE